MIFKRLFLTSSIKIFFISLFSFYISYLILTLNEIYKKSLDFSLANKQPHIIMRYKSIEKNLPLNTINKITSKIKQNNNIKSCNPFSDGDILIKLFAYRYTSTTTAIGNIHLIGLYPSIPISYPIISAKLYSLDYEDTTPTYKEFLYKFLNNPDLAIINKTTSKMLSNPINSSINFDITSFQNQKELHKDNIIVAGILTDFSNTPTIILNYKKANKLLNYPQNRISGFLIQVKNLDKLNQTVYFLKKSFKNMQISTWLDKNKKQKNIYLIFSVISKIIGFILLSFSFLVSLLILYKTFIKKLNQIIILKKIGYDLSKKVIIYLTIINTISFIFSLIIIKFSLPLITKYFEIPIYSISFVNFFYIYLLYIFLFVLVSKKLMNQKVKI